MKLTAVKAALAEAKKFIVAAEAHIEAVEVFTDKKRFRLKKARELRASSFELTHKLCDMRWKK